MSMRMCYYGPTIYPVSFMFRRFRRWNARAMHHWHGSADPEERFIQFYAFVLRKLNPSAHLFCFCVVEVFFYRIRIVCVSFYLKNALSTTWYVFMLPTKPIQSVNIIYSHAGVLLWDFCYPILFKFIFKFHFVVFLSLHRYH